MSKHTGHSCSSSGSDRGVFGLGSEAGVGVGVAIGAGVGVGAGVAVVVGVGVGAGAGVDDVTATRACSSRASLVDICEQCVSVLAKLCIVVAVGINGDARTKSRQMQTLPSYIGLF